MSTLLLKIYFKVGKLFEYIFFFVNCFPCQPKHVWLLSTGCCNPFEAEFGTRMTMLRGFGMWSQWKKKSKTKSPFWGRRGRGIGLKHLLASVLVMFKAGWAPEQLISRWDCVSLFWLWGSCMVSTGLFTCEAVCDLFPIMPFILQLSSFKPFPWNCMRPRNTNKDKWLKVSSRKEHVFR